MKRISLLLLVSGFLISCAVKQNTHLPTPMETSETQPDTQSENPLLGKWTLEFLSPVAGKDIHHFKIQKPYINFVDNNQLAGNNGCNNFAGYYTLEGDVIDFKTEGFKSTKMHCEGLDEEAFIKGLKMVNRFAVYRDSKLALMAGDAIMLSFVKETEDASSASD